MMVPFFLRRIRVLKRYFKKKEKIEPSPVFFSFIFMRLSIIICGTNEYKNNYFWNWSLSPT